MLSSSILTSQVALDATVVFPTGLSHLYLTPVHILARRPDKGLGDHEISMAAMCAIVGS